MDISFNCGWCGQQIVVDAAGAGLVTECPKCGQPITVPSRAQLQSEPPITPSQSLGPYETKKCPFCAETIKREAIVCKHCGRDLVGKRLTEAVTEKVQGPAKSVLPTVGITIPERAKHRVGLLVILAIALGLVGYIAYRAYQDSFEYNTNAFTELQIFELSGYTADKETVRKLNQKSFREAQSDIGFVTQDGWTIYKVTETPGGYTITYRRKKQ